MRIIPPGNPTHGSRRSAILDSTFAYATSTDHFEYDPELIWRPRRGHSVFDERGLRGEVREPKAADEFRILALGDSNTLGWIAPNGANWPGYLAELFVAGQVRVVNAGVWGYSSFQGRRRLQRLTSLEPDLVLISFGANDGISRSFSDEQYAARVQRLFFVNRLRIGQVALRFLDSRFPLEAGRPDGPPRPRVDLAEYRDNLRAMIRRSRDNGARPVLLTRPFTGPLASAASWKHVAPEYNAATLQIARSETTEAIDLYAAFEDRGNLFSDESHFTELGHRVAAELVYERLRPMVPGESGERRSLLVRSWPGRLHGFLPETGFPKWTDGDGIIEHAGLTAGVPTRWLAIDTYGWRTGTAADMNLRVEVDGRELAFSHRDGSAFLFELDERASVIDTLRIRSSTFSPGGDPRRLGLDVRAVRLVDDDDL